jgi:hypothetical protein
VSTERINKINKKCSDCKDDKDIKNFSYDESRDRYLSVCKSCSAKRTEKYRQKNKEKWREQSKNHSLKRKNIVDEWKSQGCIKCKDKRIYVIDAHHLDETLKEFSIGASLRGWKVTEKELEKCIPLCSNCHREFHHLQKTLNISFQEYLVN